MGLLWRSWSAGCLVLRPRLRRLQGLMPGTPLLQSPSSATLTNKSFRSMPLVLPRGSQHLITQPLRSSVAGHQRAYGAAARLQRCLPAAKTWHNGAMH